MKYILLLSLFTIGCAGGTAGIKIQAPVDGSALTNETAAGVYYNADKTRFVTLVLNGTAKINDGACTAVYQGWAVNPDDPIEIGERIYLYVEQANTCGLEFNTTEVSDLFYLEYNSYYAGQNNKKNCVWTGLHSSGLPEEFCKE